MVPHDGKSSYNPYEIMKIRLDLLKSLAKNIDNDNLRDTNIQIIKKLTTEIPNSTVPRLT
jgi:hypothetical protein